MSYPSVPAAGGAHFRRMTARERRDYDATRRFLRTRDGGDIHDDWFADQLDLDEFSVICRELGVSPRIARLALLDHGKD